MNITIPHLWTPRSYQKPLYNSFGFGKEYQRASVIWHRRAGKDSTVLNLTAREMFKRVGTYWHLFPEQSQARKAIWNGIDKQGRKITQQFLPEAVRKRTSSQEMLIETKNGSVWQMAGSDNYDSLVGSNVVGVVFSEWALANPAAWDYIRPILLENGGWAVFITTPRGRNHAYSTHSIAQSRDNWFCQTMTVDDTGVLTAEDMDSERADGMPESKILQEFYCSFEADADEQFIPTDALMRCRDLEVYVEPDDAMILGVDVARFGDDSSVIYPRKGRDARSFPVEIYNKLDTMQFAARVAEAITKYNPDGVFVDVGAMGAGVIDRLRQLGFNVTEVNFGGASDRHVEGSYRGKNKRSEMWSTMRHAIEEGVALPKNERLMFELLAPMYSFSPDNHIVLERKADMKKRGVKSPDIADALALTYAYPVQPKSVVELLEAQHQEAYDPIWGK